jgi:hypothetical protein
MTILNKTGWPKHKSPPKQRILNYGRRPSPPVSLPPLRFLQSEEKSKPVKK